MGKKRLANRFSVITVTVFFLGSSHYVHAEVNSKYAEASIEAEQEQSNEDHPDGAPKKKKELSQPTDFGSRLEQRRISKYGSFGQPLFGKSVDVGFGFLYESRNAVDSSRRSGSSVSLSTGLTDRLGLTMQLDRSFLRSYDSSEIPSSLVDRSSSSSGSAGLNVLLLPESASLPELTLGLSGGKGKDNSQKSRNWDISLGSSRTLESASIYTNLSVSKLLHEDGTDEIVRSAEGAFFLTVNHRLALGLSYGLLKPSQGLTVPFSSATAIYSPLQDWVFRFSVQNNSAEDNAQRSTYLFDVIRTFNP